MEGGSGDQEESAKDRPVEVDIAMHLLMFFSQIDSAKTRLVQKWRRKWIVNMGWRSGAPKAIHWSTWYLQVATS